MKWIPVIGLEVHAELQTRSKMFCSCPVVDPVRVQPNTAVCPICAGMPGALPVVNRKAVDYAIRVALALGCKINPTSLFARKNYFYPDLPKGYQISQYEFPLAENGVLMIPVLHGEKLVRIRRTHLEEDTGKLTHIQDEGQSYTLVDLNRAGVPLLEIVSEPDLNSVEEVHLYAKILHDILVCLGVNSGDMSKGVMRFEANVSLRPHDREELGTRVEIKNLNSFRAMERAITYEIERQTGLLEDGQQVQQQTLGWDDTESVTYPQRGKEEAHDYRYFPEPDLPPLIIDEAWIESISSELPELPQARITRFVRQYNLPLNLAVILVEDTLVAQYFEDTVQAGVDFDISPVEAGNWITGSLYGWMKTTGQAIHQIQVKPADLAGLLRQVQNGVINLNIARSVLVEMLTSGKTAEEIITESKLAVVSDHEKIANVIQQTFQQYPVELQNYLDGKVTLENWFFGQVMRLMHGKASPDILKAELHQALVKKQIG